MDDLETMLKQAGFGWLGNLGGLGGVFLLSAALWELITGGQEMWISSYGFAATLWVVLGSLGMLAFRRPLLGASAGVALGLLAGLAPTQAHAAEFRFEKEGTVKVDADESIDDTVFLAGKTAIVAGVVEGDVFAAAERVEITGTVHGNLYCGGESVTIAGEVEGNVHAAGKNLELDTKVDGSGFLAGQNVVLTEGSELSRGGYLAGESIRAKGKIGRDLYFAAKKMELSGSVERSVRGYGEQFALSSSGSVGGNVHVTLPAQNAAEIDDGAVVKGETIVEVETKHKRRAFLYPALVLAVLAKTLALLLIGLVLVTLFPSLRPAAPQSSKEVLRDMGIGFVVLLATPVAALLIAFTLIGIPIAIVLGIAYALLLYASTLVVGYFAGLRLFGRAEPSNRRLVFTTALSLLVIFLVVEIPLVGPGLNFLIHIFGMGCLVVHLRNLYVASHGPSGGSPSQPPVPA
jgi:cytoskeletal protein CcmA (bactofilin family)